MILPNPLLPGDRVALLSASSAIPEDRLAPAVEAVTDLGLEPVLYPSCFFRNRHGIFAADDRQRAHDLQSAFAAEDIRGILAIRGGHGAHRILPLLDFDAIAKTPKLFAGFSDVTTIHTALNQVCGLVTYHTVMPYSLYSRPLDEYSRTYWRRALFGSLKGPLTMPPGYPMRTLGSGRAEGVLCGGTLSLLTYSLGTPWEVDTRGKILFLEDVDEPNRRVDAMLTQLRNAGKFLDCAGILLGAWSGCQPEEPGISLSLDEIFRDLLPKDKPILADLACGHTMPTTALPLGMRVRMDADEQTLEVLG